MPSVPCAPPAPETFCFVLRRADRSASLPWTESNYTDSARSHCIDWDGVPMATLFVKTAPLRDRCMKLGWKDVTALWAARNTYPSDRFPDVTPDGYRVLVHLLTHSTDAGIPPREVGAAMGMDPEQLRAVINLLISGGWVVRSGVGTGVKYRPSTQAVSASKAA